MNIINDKTLNLHNCLLDNDERYTVFALSYYVANFGRLSLILNLHMAYKM